MLIAASADALGDLRGSCVLVPTMGALHAGHAALVRLGAEEARTRGLAGCVVSVFVNPTQFDDPSDLERYPRTLERDAALSREAGAAAVYAPAVGEVYPADGSAPQPPMPRVAYEPKLEDVARKGHFAGVCWVVKRLFELTGARAAVFGEKDWQQLQVVRAMSAELGLGVEIIPGATAREADGLAMSSRNVFLSAGDREAGLSLSRGIAAAGRVADVAEAEAVLRQTMESAGIEVNYAAIRDAQTLMPCDPADGRPMRAIVAGRAGTVRLLDNGPWPQV